MKWLRELRLTVNPFTRRISEADDLVTTNDMLTAHEAITEAVRNDEGVVIIGPRGSGKTTDTYRYLEAAGDGVLVVHAAVLGLEKLTITQCQLSLIAALQRALKITEPISRYTHAQHYQLRRLLGQFTRDHKVCLVIEDGHAVNRETLINLKRLLELRSADGSSGFAGRERLLSIVILAQPQFLEILANTSEVELRWQTVTLQGLSPEEAREYVIHKCERAGADWRELFEPKALTLIGRSLKWPLDLNKRCEQMLKKGAEQGRIPVDTELARHFCEPATNLRAVLLANGITIRDLQEALKERKLSYETSAINAVLSNGPEADPVLRGQIEDILITRRGMALAQYGRRGGKLTSERKAWLDGLHERLMGLGDDPLTVLVAVAQRAELPQLDLHRLFFDGEIESDVQMRRIDHAVAELSTERARSRRTA